MRCGDGAFLGLGGKSTGSRGGLWLGPDIRIKLTKPESLGLWTGSWGNGDACHGAQQEKFRSYFPSSIAMENALYECGYGDDKIPDASPRRCSITSRY